MRLWDGKSFFGSLLWRVTKQRFGSGIILPQAGVNIQRIEYAPS